jgi:hypothetical protein
VLEGSGSRKGVIEGRFSRMEGSGNRKMSSLEGSFTLNFVGSNFKEKVIEFFLMVSGSLFYHLVLRPVDYFRSRRKKKRNSKANRKPV